jgi:superfamily I DNA/RNA helicase
MTDTWWKDAADLVPEQAKLLDIADDTNLLIKGPPGSGKTNLLLLRANQLYINDRPNLHIVVFGSLLKQFIQIGGLQYDFPIDKIVTHSRLFIDILRAEGRHFDDSGMSIDAARLERASRMEALIQLGRVGRQFEALLLDEAQDYTPQEVGIMRSLTEVLVATADSKQRIYDVVDCSADLEVHTDMIYPLKYHFRNGLAICRVADGIVKGDPAHIPLQQHSNYNEADYPSVVTTKHRLSIEEQATEMATQISRQIFAYPDQLIGVLCPRNEELDAIHQGLVNAGLGDLVTRANSPAFDASRPVWLSTLTAAKGLEFRAVHIAGLDYLSRMGGVQKRLMYTGITRAKTSLTLYWHHKIPGYLESAILGNSPPKAPATKNQIFGKS